MRMSVCLHVKCKFELGLKAAVVNFEETVHELFQIHVSLALQVEHLEEALSNNAGQSRVLKQS